MPRRMNIARGNDILLRVRARDRAANDSAARPSAVTPFAKRAFCNALKLICYLPATSAEMLRDR